jgi:predicted transcriptional regulator
MNAHIVVEENVNRPGRTDEIYYFVVDQDGEVVTEWERITEMSGSSLRPDIAIDQINIPHIVWMNVNVNTNVYYTKLNDLERIEKKAITNTPEASTSPRILIDKASQDKHIVWSEDVVLGPSINSRIWNAVIGDDWSTKTSPTRMTYGGVDAEVPVIVMDHDHNMIVAWDDNRPDPEIGDKVWDIYYMRNAEGLNIAPLAVLEINGIPVDEDTELKFHLGDEITLFAGNSSDPNGWDEVKEYNFLITHENFTEASGWRENATFNYKFEELGTYFISVKVKDYLDGVSELPRSLIVKVSKKPLGHTSSILSSPEVQGTVVASSIGITAALGYVVGGTEIGKYKFFSLLGVPLYSRIKKEKTLDNYIRGQIHGYILAKPGCHYNQIKQTLNLNNGTLAYHLRKLEREEFIKSQRDGMYKRFYPQGLKIPKRTLKLSKMQKRILDVITMNPGISQKEVAKEVGISAPAVIYHIGVLAGAKLVRREKKGSRVEYYIILQADDEDGGLPAGAPAAGQ